MTYFDHFAQSPSTKVGDWITHRTQQQEYSLIRPYIANSNAKILEIGPGLGGLAEIFQQAGFQNYSVVEPNTIMRERLIGKGIAARNYRIPYLQEPDSVYDVIILMDVFEHLNSADDAQIFVAEAWRVMRSAGILCIVAPDYLHWQSDFFNADYTHANISTVRRTQQLFYNQGFAMKRWVYLSGFVAGRCATGLSWLVRSTLFFAGSNGFDQKLYKLKLTFLRRFLLIGAK